MICAICGKEIKDNKTKDHYIPKAVYKWSMLDINSSEYKYLKNIINSDHNITYVHQGCNLDKLDSIIKISKIKITEDKRKKLSEIKNLCQSYIDKYKAFKNKLLKKQNNTCYKCRCEIDSYNSTIRRIKRDKYRDENNACLLCKNCNLNWYRTRSRHVRGHKYDFY